MKKVTVTYHAPPGDSKVVEVWGHTFFDGKAEEIEASDLLIEKMRGNRHFEISDGPPPEIPKPDGGHSHTITDD